MASGTDRLRMDDVYETLPRGERWTAVQLAEAVELRGWACADSTALAIVRELHDRGYMEPAGDWHGDTLWQRSEVEPARRRGRYVLDAPTEAERLAARIAELRAELAARQKTTWVWCYTAGQAMAAEVHEARGCTCRALVRKPGKAA